MGCIASSIVPLALSKTAVTSAAGRVSGCSKSTLNRNTVSVVPTVRSTWPLLNSPAARAAMGIARPATRRAKPRTEEIAGGRIGVFDPNADATTTR